MRADGRLRLATFNLMSGRSLTDGLVHPALMSQAAMELDPDLLAVQEVDRHQPRSGIIDQPGQIAGALSASAYRFEETVRGVPGEPGWVPGIGQVPDADTTPGYGVALISRLPVREWHVLRLTPARGRFPIPIPSRPPQLLWLRDEPRAVIAAVLESPRLTVACAHLSFVPWWSSRQLREVHQWLSRLPGPHVLMGDLNQPARTVARVTGWTPLVSAPTFPAPAPRLQLDHVLARGLDHRASAAGRVLRMPISDHRAAVVDLHLG